MLRIAMSLLLAIAVLAPAGCGQSPTTVSSAPITHKDSAAKKDKKGRPSSEASFEEPPKK